MRKLIAMIMAVLFSSAVICSAAADDVSDRLEGVWFISSVLGDDCVYDVSQSSEQAAFEFDAENTGFRYNVLGSVINAIRWMEDKDGNVRVFIAAGNDVSMMTVSFRDNNPVLTGDEYSYVLSREFQAGSGIQNGLYAEYTCAAPEGSEEGFDELIDSTISIIRSRLDNVGCKESDIKRTGGNGLRVEIPGCFDSSLPELISAKGKLEFRNPDGEVFMTGDMIQTAEYYYSDGDHMVAFTLTDEGTKVFADVTSASTGRTISIFLDGEQLIAPTVQSPITNGSGVINGLGNAERATAIAAQIQAPSLPLDLTEKQSGIVYDLHSAEEAAAARKAEKENAARVILKLGDEEITKGVVQEKIRTQLDAMAYMYSLYGVSYDISDPENIAAAKKEALDSLRKSLVLTAKAKEFGFDILSDEEQAAVQGKARESYESAMEYVKQYMLEDTESMDADLVTQKAVEKLNEMEITLDSYIKTETEQVINEKLRAYIVRDVSVSAEEIKTEQDKRTEAENEAWDLSEDGIRESLLADKQDELYNAMVDYWIKNAGVEEHLDELDD